MPIIPPFISGFPWTDPIYASVQPFTQRDGTTYLEILRALDQYVKGLAAAIDKVLIDGTANFEAQIAALQAAVNEALASQADQINVELDQQKADVAAQLAAQALEVANQLAAQNVVVTNQLDAQNQWVLDQLASQTQQVQAILDALVNESIQFSDPVMLAIVTNLDSNSRQFLDAHYAPRTVHVVVGWGQSNMAGRGILGDRGLSYSRNDRIWQFGANSLALSVAPPWVEHIDAREYNIGPMYDYALHLLADVPEGDIVLLVPGALGGSGLVRTTAPTWNSDVPDNLFDRGMSQLDGALLAAAQKWGGTAIKVSALLWHQGEADDTLQPYMAAFEKIVGEFRAKHGATVPLVIGKMWDARIALNSSLPNQAHAQLCKNLPYAHFARFPQPPVNQIGDGTHISAPGQRALASSMYDAYKMAVVNQGPPAPLAAAADTRIAGFQVSELAAGPVTRDALGGALEIYGTTLSNVGSFINDGGVTLDPNNVGAGTSLILLDSGYDTGFELKRQLFSGYGNGNIIVLAFKNVYDYVFIANVGEKFALRRRADGVTTTLAVSELAFTPSQVSIRVSGARIDGKHSANGVAFGGTFPVNLPEDYVRGNLYGMGIPATEAGLTKINRLELYPIVDRF